MISAFPFVPEGDVLYTQQQLRPQLPFDLDTFAAWIEYTWMVSWSFIVPDPNLEPVRSIFNEITELPRSTNMAVKDGTTGMLSCTHRTMWKFLKTLKKEQNLTKIKF